MQIRINGRQTALKKGTSFEYVAENRLFSGSDGYTLSITFPLKDSRRRSWQPYFISQSRFVPLKESVILAISQHGSL